MGSEDEYKNLAENSPLQQVVERLFEEQHENMNNLLTEIAGLISEEKPLLLGVATFLHVFASPNMEITFTQEKKTVKLTPSQEQKYGTPEYRERSKALLRTICLEFDRLKIVAPWYIAHYRPKGR
jgi:hypothetical protein